MTVVNTPPPDFVRYQKRVASVAFVVMSILFLGLVFRLAYINTAMASQLRSIASRQHESVSIIPARRGSILDARGRVLVGSHLCSSVFADPGLIEHPDEVALQLAPILDMEAGVIENEIRSSNAPRFCWLARRLDDTQAEAISALKIHGIGLRGEFKRRWAMNDIAAHILGFTGSDGRGLEGLERVYNSHLAGTDGKRSMLRDARRRVLGQGDSALVDPKDGGHLVLTIDSVIQKIVQNRLRSQVEAFDAESGIAIVMSPKSGDVLAMACEPTFDPNHYFDFDKQYLRNRVITDPVEPGSTFKPFIVAGAIQRRYVSTTEKIDCHNGLHYFGRRRMHDTKPHGLMDVRDIVVYSSNIGMGIIGTRMGNEVLYQVITGLGYGETTQIGLPGESSGIVFPVSRWTEYSTTSVPMGQELAVTPIQLATAFSALVNRGYLLRPRVVKKVLASDYSEIQSFDEPEIIRQVIAEDVAGYMTEKVLPGVVERGGKELRVGDYSMCGKTGTAQVPYPPEDERKGYEPDAYLSSFIGAAPVTNPEIVVLVMIRKPDKHRGHYGRVVAGPAVRDIVRSTLQYLQVPSDTGS